MKYKTFDKALYDYTAGVYCGVLVTEPVMKKLAKLQAEHLEKVKRLLNNSDGEVFPSMWTLHYPKGKQTHVRFIDTSGDLESSISNATHGASPKHVPLCFISGSMDDAKNMADAHFEATGVIHD